MSAELQRRAERAVRPTVHYVREVTVRPIGIVAEAAQRRTRHTIEDTHPIFWIMLRCLPSVFFLGAFLLAAHLAWASVNR